LFLLGAMLLRLLSDRGMFIDGVNLGGAALVPGEENLRRLGHRRPERLLGGPGRRAAPHRRRARHRFRSVGVEWPATVTILVTERIPVVTWLEGPQRWWVDADGQKFEARAELPGLLPVRWTISPPAPSFRPRRRPRDRAGAGSAGRAATAQLRPNIEMLHYDSLHGLSYADGRGWRGYFGVGTDMPQKLAVYEKLVDDLIARGIQPKTISVETVRAPYYSK
jgi:hypothetical protein